jgi:hypothetical protein
VSAAATQSAPAYHPSRTSSFDLSASLARDVGLGLGAILLLGIIFAVQRRMRPRGQRSYRR